MGERRNRRSVMLAMCGLSLSVVVGCGYGQVSPVAYEYAKVRKLYADLGVPDRTAIEFFQGGHEIHGQDGP